MMNLKKEQALWTGNYMDNEITKAIAWSKKTNNVKFISLSPAEKAKWDSKLGFIIDKWVKTARAKGLPAEAILKDIKSFTR